MTWTSVPGLRCVVAYRVGRILLRETVLVHACGPSDATLVGSGVSGFDLGMGQQYHSRAGGCWAAMGVLRRVSCAVPGADRSLAVLAGLCARGRRRPGRRDERRWRHRCPPGAAPPPGPAAVLLPRTRIPGSGLPATGSGRAVAHRKACRPTHERPPHPTKHSLPSVAPHQQPQEGGRATPGTYVMLNHDRVNCGEGAAMLLPWSISPQSLTLRGEGLWRSGQIS